PWRMATVARHRPYLQVPPSASKWSCSISTNPRIRGKQTGPAGASARSLKQRRSASASARSLNQDRVNELENGESTLSLWERARSASPSGRSLNKGEGLKI